MGAALRGRRALILAVGDIRRVSWGQRPTLPASGWRVTCAPPLLQRIVVVGGAIWAFQREMQAAEWRAWRKALTARKRIAAEKSAHLRICSGRGGGLGTPGDISKRARRSKPQGSALDEPTHFRVTGCTGLEQLNGSHRSAVLTVLIAHLPAAYRQLLQCAFGQRRCRPTPPAVGVLQG